MPRDTLTPFDKLCADALADEVAVLVRREVIDSRSPAADALLDYRNPPSSPRADRLAALEAENTRLYGALRAAADALRDLQSTACRCLGEAYEPPEHLPTCPWWKVAAADAAARRVLAETPAVTAPASDNRAIRQPETK